MKPTLLLHGALGTLEELRPLSKCLSTKLDVHSINFYGHGGEPATADFSIEYFANQVLDWLQTKQFEKVYLVGYSLGGYVALYLAINFPQKIAGVITIATKLYWDESVAEREIAKLQPASILTKAPAFAATLQQMHAPGNWKEIALQTVAMLKHLGRFNPVMLLQYRTIRCPVLLVIGDRDKLVTFVETTTVYRELSNGQIAVLPGTPHHLKEMNITLLANIIKTFISGKAL